MFCHSQGVSNGQLVKENAAIAEMYQGKSVAEQNSVDLAWNLLNQDDRYIYLRHAIYSGEEEKSRFRKLVINSVMATGMHNVEKCSKGKARPCNDSQTSHFFSFFLADIMDPDLKNLRNSRWHKAFSKDSENESEDTSITVNRKATSESLGCSQGQHTFPNLLPKLLSHLHFCSSQSSSST